MKKISLNVKWIIYFKNDKQNEQAKNTLGPVQLNSSQQFCQSIYAVENKYLGKTLFGQRKSFGRKRMRK